MLIFFSVRRVKIFPRPVSKISERDMTMDKFKKDDNSEDNGLNVPVSPKVVDLEHNEENGSLVKKDISKKNTTLATSILIENLDPEINFQEKIIYI